MPRVPGLKHLDLVSPTWEAYLRLAVGRGSAPGVISRHRLGAHQLFVATDPDGSPIGILLVSADRSGAPAGLHVVVDPRRRRQGIASALYAQAARAGIAIEELSGRNGLTPDGTAFRASRHSSAAESPLPAPG